MKNWHILRLRSGLYAAAWCTHNNRLMSYVSYLTCCTEDYYIFDKCIINRWLLATRRSTVHCSVWWRYACYDNLIGLRWIDNSSIDLSGYSFWYGANRTRSPRCTSRSSVSSAAAGERPNTVAAHTHTTRTCRAFKHRSKHWMFLINVRDMGIPLKNYQQPVSHLLTVDAIWL
jgi:hypothetical protein